MRLLHIVASLLLMMSVLISSTGFRLSQHWCGDSLVSFSLLGQAQPCDHYETSVEPPCPFHAKKPIEKKCCDQRTARIDANNFDYELQAIEMVKSPMLLLAVIHAKAHVFEMASALISVKYRNHSPPLIDLDICILVQTFLL
ncbi:MAG: hypothetical protein HQ500_03405 [Flavobacteriales bacterium]|nr:hypothetical protein [Flavobacteriales bacterium]